MIKELSAQTDSNRQWQNQNLLCYLLHHAPIKNSLLSRVRSQKVSNNLQIIIYENTLVAAAGVEPATFAL